MNIFKYRVLFVLGIFVFVCQTVAMPYVASGSSDLRYKTETIGCLDKRVSLNAGSVKVGYLYYKKLASVIILYNLYVYPEYRNHGFAQNLLNHVSNEFKAQGFAKIFIQPGPYELLDNELVQINSQEKIDSLVRLYSRTGFIPSPSYLKRLVSFYYYVAGIHENADLLMNY